jgi:5'-3' exonuclease
MKTLLLIDTSQIVHSNTCVKKSKNLDTPLVDMVVKSIETIVWDVSLKGVDVFPILVLDSRPSFRLNIYPEYKAHRSESGIDWDEIKQGLRDKYAFVEYPNLEADDLIYLIANNTIADKIIVSSDRDLGQVVDKCTNTQQYCPKLKEFLDYSKELTWKAKILMGDASDNISKGVPATYLKKGKITALRLGEKTLQKDFDELGSVNKVLSKYGLSTEEPNIQRNYLLIVFIDDVYRAYIENYDELVSLLKKLDNINQ